MVKHLSRALLVQAALRVPLCCSPKLFWEESSKDTHELRSHFRQGVMIFQGGGWEAYWGHRTAQLGAAPCSPCFARRGEGAGSCRWRGENSFPSASRAPLWWCRVQGEDMQAVKHELGASFPLAPCREEEWGGFPPRHGLQTLQYITVHGQRGGNTEHGGCQGMLTAPPPLPVRL